MDDPAVRVLVVGVIAALSAGPGSSIEVARVIVARIERSSRGRGTSWRAGISGDTS